MNNLRAIQNSIIATYLLRDSFCDLNNIPKLNKLNPKDFIGSFYKKIVEKINHAISTDDALGVLSFEIQDKCEGTRYEDDFLEILASNPLPFKTLPKHTEVLTMKRIEREIMR